MGSNIMFFYPGHYITGCIFVTHFYLNIYQQITKNNPIR